MPEWCRWKATVQRVLGIPHPLNTDGWKAGNSMINAKYTKGAACEIWVTQISCNSCLNGVHGKPLLEWCPWKAAVQRVLGIPHLLNADGQKAGNSLINGTYIPGAAYVQKAGNSVINGTYTPGAASTVEGVPGMPHPLNADGRMAGNSVINAKYTKGAACEVWVTQISSNSCQNGFHGKPLLSGCQGCCIRSIQMDGWLAIV
ncbi:hypothetical protein BKA82DRAFT_4016045 [Pisolithus tinctorius]|nr:hypothetical protein BKA82DRAFT_4016045 [Pisolithus tinctorius]